MLNRIFRSFALLLVVGFLATLFFHEVYSDSTPASRESNLFTLAKSVVNSVEAEIDRERNVLQQMDEIRQAIVSAVGVIDKKGRMNSIQAIVGRFGNSPVSVVNALANQIDQTTTALDIVPKLETLNMDIDYFYDNTITPIFTRGPATEVIPTDQGKKIKGIGYNLAWDNYIDAYNALSGQDLQDANNILFGYENDRQNRVEQLKAMKMSIPDPETVTVKQCNGVCGSFRLDADELKVTCPNCGVVYYSCDTKKEKYHSKPPGSDKFNCEPELSVSFNKTTFWTGEELVANVEIDGLYMVNMHISGKYRAIGYPDPDDLTKTEMRTTFTDDDVGYHEVTISVYYIDGENGMKFTEESYYLIGCM